MRDIIGVGCVALDTVLVVDQPITSLDGKAPVRRQECRLGGLTAVALAAAARFGASVGYAGLLGKSAASQEAERLMREAGIDTLTAVRRDHAEVIESVIVVGTAPPTRYILYTEPELSGAHPTEPARDVLLGAKALLCDGFSPVGALRAARIFRAEGRPVVVDVEADHGPATHELIDVADHVIVSWGFAERYVGAGDPAAAARALWHPGKAAVVVTAGSEGCWVTDAETYPKARHVPAFRVAAIDTTGCGDVFHGVYAALLTREPSVWARLRQAAAAAAVMAATGRGSAQLPGPGAIKDLLSEPFAGT